VERRGGSSACGDQWMTGSGEIGNDDAAVFKLAIWGNAISGS